MGNGESNSSDKILILVIANFVLICKFIVFLYYIKLYIVYMNSKTNFRNNNNSSTRLYTINTQAGRDAISFSVQNLPYIHLYISLLFLS